MKSRRIHAVQVMLGDDLAVMRHQEAVGEGALQHSRQRCARVPSKSLKPMPVMSCCADPKDRTGHGRAQRAPCAGKSAMCWNPQRLTGGQSQLVQLIFRRRPGKRPGAGVRRV
jgi:hypothetical protein